MDTKLFKNIALIIALVSLAVSWRIINHNFQIAPNLELVTVVSVLAVLIIGWKAALIVPIATMVLSDLVIGNSSIFVFTWSSFAIIGFGALMLRKLNNKPKSQIFYSAIFAISSSFFFFIVTNFGVWAQGWYPATTAGLVDCFLAAIPFYRTMLVGNVIIVPASVAVWQAVKAHQASKSLVVNSLVR